MSVEKKEAVKLEQKDQPQAQEKSPSIAELSKLLEQKFEKLAEDFKNEHKKIFEQSRKYEEQMASILDSTETNLMTAPKPTFKSLDPIQFFRTEIEEYNEFEATYGMKKKYNINVPSDNLKFRMLLDLRQYKDAHPEKSEDEAVKFISSLYADEIRAL